MTSRCSDCPQKYLRSKPQHGRFFSVMTEAFKHWPHRHPFQPRNAEHLRYWLEMRAGLFDVACTVRPEHMSVNAIQGALGAVLEKIVLVNPKMGPMRDHVFLEMEDGQLVCKVTRSIAWRALPQDDFTKLSGDVYEVLAVCGLDHEQLLSEKDQAA